MKCKKCNREADTEGFCSLCFQKVILVRVSKHIRSCLPKEGEFILSLDSDLAVHFVQKALKRPFSLHPDGLRILSWSADDLAEWFLGRISKHEKSRPNEILLFEPVLDRELEIYARLVGIKYKPKNKPLLENWTSLKQRDKDMVLGLHKTILAWTK